MAIPTATDIDDAVPTDGEPSRALVNAVLKELLAALSYLPDDGTIPIRSVENENFSGGRLKTSFGTDPDDCVNLQQLELATASLARRAATAKPASMTSPGEKGDYFIDDPDSVIYICIEENQWRTIMVTGWE